MKFLILILSILLITACNTLPTSKDYLQACKVVCKGNVSHYTDDNIDCQCRTVTSER